MILINGEHKQHIDVADRGFQYGDGLFETIEVNQGRAVFLNRHLKRLNEGCKRLQIPVCDKDQLIHEVKLHCANSAQAVLKIILTRGLGGRGYRQPEAIKPTRVISLHPYPDYPPSYQEHGICARFCDTRLGLNPALAGIKHLNRLEQVLARAEWQDPDIQEGLMSDINGWVIEGTMSNLFYVKHNTLYTATLDNTGVAGIVRGIVLMLSPGLKIDCLEHRYTKAELLSADELFVCNSIIGIWPVKQLAETEFMPGPVTKRLQSGLAELKREALRADK